MLSSTLDFLIISSLEFLRLQVTILTDRSADPMATRFELGWKDREIMGAEHSLSREVTVQHYDSML